MDSDTPGASEWRPSPTRVRRLRSPVEGHREKGVPHGSEYQVHMNARRSSLDVAISSRRGRDTTARMLCRPPSTMVSGLLLGPNESCGNTSGGADLCDCRIRFGRYNTRPFRVTTQCHRRWGAAEHPAGDGVDPSPLPARPRLSPSAPAPCKRQRLGIASHRNFDGAT